MICYGAIKYVNAHTVYTMCLINKMKKHQICKCHVLVHASQALQQWYNLCMSHHDTTHSRHILQLTLLASLCKYGSNTAQ